MDVRETARVFVAEAFTRLRAEFVIPTPVFHPYVRVGHDYFGDTIRGLPGYAQLEEQLDSLYPDRFADPLERRQNPEFAATYIFSFIEACIARCGRGRSWRIEANDGFDPNSDAVSESIDELIAVLGSEAYEVVCCRFVSHVRTEQNSELTIGDVTIVPERDGHKGLTSRIGEEIAGAASAFNRDDPRPWDPPHALLIVRERATHPDPFEVGKRLSRNLDSFLRVTRLLSAGTARSLFQVTGITTLVSRMAPFMSDTRSGGSWVRRTVWLSEQQASAFESIGNLVDLADVKRDGMAATSFDVALGKFNSALSQGSPFEQIVDLATALEAILAGGETETEGLTLRLRNRTAALLSTDNDPAIAVFADVGLLYGLRSKLVHGGQIKERDLRRDVGKISTMPEGEVDKWFSVAIGRAVDRMRDLVRRAILARLCLAGEPEPVWPFGDSTAVDQLLSDDRTRTTWRMTWHTKLADLGVAESAEQAADAVDFFTPHEQEERRRRQRSESQRATQPAPEDAPSIDE